MAITVRAGGSATGGATAVSTLACSSFSCQLLDFIIVFYAIRTAASTGTAPTDTIGNTYVQLAVLNNTVRLEMWACWSIGSNAANIITMNLSATSKAVIVAESFTGVVGYRKPATATASAANPAVLVFVDPSGCAVAGFVGEGTGTFTAGASGSLDQDNVTSGGNASTNVGGALVHFVNASAGQTVNIGVTNADTTWVKCGVSLEAGVPAQPDDYQMFDERNVFGDSMGLLDMLHQVEEENVGFSSIAVAGGQQMMGFRGQWALKAGMGSEFEAWGFKPPVVVVLPPGFDEQDMQVAQAAGLKFTEDERELHDWGWLPPVQAVARDEVYYEHLPWQFFTEADNESEQFGFNPPVVVTPHWGFDEDEGIYGEVYVSQEDEDFGFYIRWTQAQDEEHSITAVYARQDLADEFASPTIAGFVDDAQTPEQVCTIVQEDEVWGFNPPVVEVEVGYGDEEIQLPEIEPVWLEDEPWGFPSFAFIAGGIHQMSYHGFWSLRAGMGSDVDQWGFNPPTVVLHWGFDEDELQMIGMEMAYHEEDFGYNFRWAEGDEQAPLQNSPITDVVTDQASLIPWGYDSVDTQGANPGQFVFSDEEMFGYNQPSVTGELQIEQEMVAWEWMALDQIEEFGFQAPVVALPAMDYTLPDEPIWQQQPRVDWASEDVFRVIVIELPWDVEWGNVAQQESFYFQADETEWQNWGWEPPLAHVSVDESPQDAQPQMTGQVKYHEEDFGLQVQFYADSEDQGLVKLLANVDQVEDFGFEIRLDAGPEDMGVSLHGLGAYDVDESWGFNPAVAVQAITPFDDEQAYTRWTVIVEKEEEELFKLVTQPFSYGDEIDQVPNPPWPLTHQVEFDQVGQQAPFIISQPFDEQDMQPGNPPWPVVDFADFDSAWNLIILPPSVVLKFVGVLVRPELWYRFVDIQAEDEDLE